MSTEPQLGKFVPLKMVVSLFSDQYDRSEGDQDRFWLMGMRALVELNYDISAEPKTVRLPVNMTNMTVQIPGDALAWSKIGILDANGKISTLKINTALSTFRDANPNRIADLSPDINSGVGELITAPFMFFNYYQNGYCQHLYGVGGGLVQYGECKVDEAANIIVLSPDFKYTSVMLEYISSPAKNIDFMVPLSLQEAVIAFIAWKMKLDSRQNYFAEVMNARRRQPGKRVTLQEINQVIRESNGGYLHA